MLIANIRLIIQNFEEALWHRQTGLLFYPKNKSKNISRQLKISDNEVEFLFGTTDYDKGAALLKEKYNIPLILITLGKDATESGNVQFRVGSSHIGISFIGADHNVTG